MPERAKGKSRKRSHLAKKFIDLGNLENSLPSGWNIKQILLGILLCILTTALLVEYEFQRIPDYQVGDIADRTIEAPQNFTLVDEAETARKRIEALTLVPATFRFDLGVTQRVISEFRISFVDARDAIAQKRNTLGLGNGSFPREQKAALIAELGRLLPRFAEGRTIEICLRHNFSEELEEQLVNLLLQAMKHPGVVVNREILLRYRDRGILLRDPSRGEAELLSDWMVLRDLGQAYDLLKQQEYELTAVSGEEKRELLSFLEGWIVPNTEFDEPATKEAERRALAEVDPVLNQVKRGKTIVRSGDEINESNLAQLEALRRLQYQDRWIDQVLGVALIVAFFYGILWIFLQLRLFHCENPGRDFLLLITVLFVSLAITRGLTFLADLVSGSLRVPELQAPIHFYFVVPVALGAFLLVLLSGVNLALFYSMLHAVFVGVYTEELSILVYSLLGSLVAILALQQYRERSALLRAGMAVGIVNLVVLLAIQLIASNYGLTPFLVRCAAGLFSGLTAAMLTSALLPSLESLFGLTTDIRLLELSNLNSPMLRRLALEAPGTYHHSITVGTLAEAGAEAIGANTLLIRVGAYYHDIGKLKHPEYYVENQLFSVNKHEGLSPTMSSLILASHVKDGLAIAQEIKLGAKVSDLIPQHHGTRVMTFFYQKAKEAAEARGVEISENDFRYPGPKPQSKEAAILMLADQVEAAARTLQDPTPGQIRSLIARMTQSTIQDGQLDECEINMMELTQVAQAFERVLTGMYHHRIDYPGFDFNKQQVEGPRPEHQRVQ